MTTNERSRLLPVTVISGFFGAGKSWLTSRLQQQSASRRIASIVCASHHDVIEQVARIAGRSEFDHLLLECSGGSDPLSVAVQFLDDGPARVSLAGLARIDSMLTVVDAASVLDRFCSWNTLAEEGFASNDSRLVVDVVTEQIEFADVIVLSNVEDVPERAARNVKTLVRALNRGAEVLRGEWGNIPRLQLLGTQRFDFVRTRNMAGWARAYDKIEPDFASADRISSFLYRARRPFHPQRFMQFFRAEWPGVVRTRGHFWLASRMDWIGEMTQAGGARRHRAVGTWWATILADNPADARAMQEVLGTDWDPQFGDRRQEFAFVGIDLDEAQLRDQLDQCLLTDEEMQRGPQAWQDYRDPFPSWDASTTPRSSRVLN